VSQTVILLLLLLLLFLLSSVFQPPNFANLPCVQEPSSSICRDL